MAEMTRMIRIVNDHNKQNNKYVNENNDGDKSKHQEKLRMIRKMT